MKEISDFVSFLRQRAQIERQMGTNQLMGGSDSGKWRIERANMYDLCADSYAIAQSEIIQLKAQITTLKEELEKCGQKKI